MKNLNTIKETLGKKEINNNHIAPNKIFVEYNYVSLGKREKLVEELKKNNINLFSEKYTGTKEQNYILAFSLKNNKGTAKLSEWKTSKSLKEYKPFIRGEIANLQSDKDHFTYTDYKKGLDVMRKFSHNLKSEIIKKGDSEEFINKLNQVHSISDAETIFGPIFGNQHQIVKKYLDSHKNAENKEIIDNNSTKPTLILLKEQIKTYETALMNLVENLKLETDGGKITKREMTGSIGKFANEVEYKVKKQIIKIKKNYRKKLNQKK